MISSIQALRGIAAILVVYYHAHGLIIKRHAELGLSGGFWLTEQNITKFGAVGVDIFFVISGFIIFYSSWDKNIGGGEFFARRAIRIYPIYWVACAMVLLISVLPGSSSAFSAWDIIPSLFLFPSHFQGDVKPILEVGWTLYYEMFFYSCFAALIWQSKTRILIEMTFFFCALITVGKLYTSDFAVWTVVTNDRLFEFIVGGWFAYAFVNDKIKWNRVLRSAFLTLLLISVSLFVFVDGWREIYPGIVIRGPIAVSIFALVLFDPASRHIFSGRLLQFLGNSSYSIYLFHMFPFILISGVWKRGILVPPVNAIAIWVTLIALGVAVGLAAHVLVEQPLLDFFQRRRVHKTTTTEKTV